MKAVRRLIGLVCLLIALGLAGLSVVGGFGMAGLQAGLVIFCGIGGAWLLTA